MNYFVSRNGQEYGPYTLSDLQRYVASGNILGTDLARSEGMSEFVPVAQIIGTIQVPQAPVQTSVLPVLSTYPDPPNLHWGLVLLFGFLTCGLFTSVWDVVQAAWMKKVAPESKAIFYYIASLVILVLVFFTSIVASMNHTKSPLLSLFELANFVIIIIGRFSLKASLEEHFNSVEPMALSLSGIMTFFFGCIYFQYHLNEINRRKNLTRMGAYAA